MKYSKALTVTAALVLASGMASAADIEVTPETYEADLVAGDTHQQNITLNNQRNFHAEINLTTNITAENTNSNGVTVSYSNKEFVLQPNEERTEQIIIETAYDLKPDNFNFTTTVRGDKFRDNDGDGDSSDDDSETFSVDINDTLDVVDDQDKDNETTPLDQTSPGNETEGGENETEGTDNNETGVTEPGTEDPDQQGFFSKAAEAATSPAAGITYLVLLAVIAGGAYIYWKRNKEQQTAEDTQEEDFDVRQE